ncbi:hypothetical protein INT46_001319 [Mucor plumbeus]|uniref:Uncharacterized protein n=1 Tax=Mucor plumbeus TaxID=97098 RepID=A0A8H7USM6_9FUNG|nr:hypothetical protein INT46_001319 [Mucor plumbeus]
MPGGLERQNAFSEYYQSKPFTEANAYYPVTLILTYNLSFIFKQLQCHICTEYEYDEDWIKIKCKCNAPPIQYAYAHKHCLRMASKCKICGQAYITTIAPPTPIIAKKSQYSVLLGT